MSAPGAIPDPGNVTREANVRLTATSTLSTIDLNISLTVTIVGRGPGIAVDGLDHSAAAFFAHSGNATR